MRPKEKKTLRIINPSTAYKRNAYYLYFIDRKFLLKKRTSNREFDFLLRRKTYRKMAIAEILHLGNDYLKQFSLLSYLFFSDFAPTFPLAFKEIYFASFRDFVAAKVYFFQRPLTYLRFAAFLTRDYFEYEYEKTKEGTRIVVPQSISPDLKKFIYALNHPDISLGPIDSYTYAFYRRKFVSKGVDKKKG